MRAEMPLLGKSEGDLLSARALAARYPLPTGNSFCAWVHALERWRKAALLREGLHWIFQRPAGHIRPQRCYYEGKLIVVIWQLREDYFASRLREAHRPAFVVALQPFRKAS